MVFKTFVACLIRQAEYKNIKDSKNYSLGLFNHYLNYLFVYHFLYWRLVNVSSV